MKVCEQAPGKPRTPARGHWHLHALQHEETKDQRPPSDSAQDTKHEQTQTLAELDFSAKSTLALHQR